MSKEWNSGPITGRGYELRFDQDSATGFLTPDTLSDTELISSLSTAWPTKTTDIGVTDRRMMVMKAHETMLKALYHVVPDCPSGWDEVVRTEVLPIEIQIADY